MKNFINILRWIAAIILAIGIIIFGAVQIVSSTILSKSFVLSKLEETNYYTNTYSQVFSDFENYIYQSGLDKTVIEGIVSIEDVENDTKYIISNIYDGKEAKIDVSKLKDKLSSNIKKSIEGRNIASSTQNAIDKFVDTIAEQYQESILHTSIENSIYDGLISTKKIISKATTISVTMIGITAIFILASKYKKFWQNMSLLGVSLFTAGIVYTVVDIFVRARVDIKNITILSEAMSYSIRTIIFSTFNAVRYTAILLLILGFILIILGNLIRASKHSVRKQM